MREEGDFERWLSNLNRKARSLPDVPVGGSDTKRSVGVRAPVIIGAEDEDVDNEDRADSSDAAISSDVGIPGLHTEKLTIENTKLVAAAFRAVGGPRFADVRLKRAPISSIAIPTHREFATSQARKGNRSRDW